MKHRYYKYWIKGISGDIKMSGEGYIQVPDHCLENIIFDYILLQTKESFRTLIMNEGFPKIQRLKHKPKYLNLHLKDGLGN